VLKIVIPAITFILVFISHLLYFKIVNFGYFTQDVNGRNYPNIAQGRKKKHEE